MPSSPTSYFTPWPIDTHFDHQSASLLTFRAWWAAQRRFELYYYEVDLGTQTLGFHPTHYVDITSVREKKKAALFAHESQDGQRIYSQASRSQVMVNFRGRESGCEAAEAFVHLGRLSGAPPVCPA